MTRLAMTRSSRNPFWCAVSGVTLPAVVLAVEDREETAAAEPDLRLLVVGVARGRQRTGQQAAIFPIHPELLLERLVHLVGFLDAAGIDADELAGLARAVEALVLLERRHDLMRHLQVAQDRQRDAGDDLGLLGARRDMDLPAAALDGAGVPLHEDTVAPV